MRFHYGCERKQLEKRWEVLRIEYEKAGMSKEDIDVMYRFDLDELNSNRRFANHITELEEVEPTSIEAYSYYDTYLLEKPRYAWVEEVEDEFLYKKLKQLKVEELELVTLLVIDGYTQTEIAKKQGVVRNSIWKKINKIKKFLQ